jgi:hypothetical protein
MRDSEGYAGSEDGDVDGEKVPCMKEGDVEGSEWCKV